MDVVLQAEAVHTAVSDLEVSILVLMDVVLQDGRIGELKGTSKSFNPCFDGCGSSRPNGYFQSNRERVSILVLMDVVLQEPPGGSHACPHRRVSILVLMDVVLQA